MKVVFQVIGMGAKKYGGLERYMLKLADQLKQKQTKLVVIFDQQPLAKTYIDDLESLGAEWYVVSYNEKLSFVKQFWALLKKYRPMVVHTNFSSNIYLVHLLSLLCGVPVRLATEHCLPCLNSLKNRFSYTMLSMLCDFILPVSECSSKVVKKGLYFNKKKVRTLYLGVEEFSFDKREMRSKYDLPQDKFIIMNVAYHNPIKGVDVLLKAYNLFLKKYNVHDTILCQIGGGQNGKDTELLKKLSHNLDLDDKIIWMGLQNSVSEILCAGDLYCQPSRSEGTPLSLMEASFACLPIVATRVGGIPEVARNQYNALLVEPESFETMADCLYQFYKNENLRRDFGNNGNEFAKAHFTLSTQVSTLIQNYYHFK